MWVESRSKGVTHGLATTVERRVEGGASWTVPCWGGVLGGEAARRRVEVSTQMCSEAVKKVSLSLCELGDGMQAVCMQGPSCLDCRRPRATG